MTKIVVTILAGRVEEMVDQARSVPGDLLEFRFDALARPDEAAVTRAIRGADRPCVATVRSKAEGAASDLSDPVRQRLLRSALAAGATWVDLERRDRALVADARKAGVQVIAAHHLSRPVEGQQLFKELRAGLAIGGDVTKLAMPVTRWRDVVELLSAAEAAREEGLPYSLMGIGDPFLRALAPSLGMTFVYASPTPSPVVPGQLPAVLMARLVEQGAQLVGLIGDRIGYSLSPPMQNAAFAYAGIPAAYGLIDVERAGESVEALRRLPFLGANVTVPHKEAIVGHLDRLDPLAERIAAVNTVVVESHRLVGYNTDVDGVRIALGALPDGPALILGAGGAARACAIALNGRPLRFVNRTPERTRATVSAVGGEAFGLGDLPRAAEGAAIVINATPGVAELPWEKVRRDAVVLDLVYRPLDTPLLQAARRRGLRTVTGDRVLLHQGAASFKLWTKKPPPLSVMEGALKEAYDREG